MAGENRTAPHIMTFLEELKAHPYKFGFYRAIRRLDSLSPDKPRVGWSMRLTDEPVRLRQEPSLAFAPSTLASFKPGAEGRPHQLSQFFFGLFGPNGPLPLHLTEYARQRSRSFDDPTLSAFADIFHHRLLAFFYKAWASSQPTVNFDRPATDRFQVYLGSLCGLGMPAFRDRDDMPDLAKFYFCGRLSGQTRSKEGLAAIISGYFQVDAEIEEFVGEWRELPKDSLFRLGESMETGALGATAVLGSRIWDCQQKIRLQVGPMGKENYDRFLPDGGSIRRLVSLVRNYLGYEYSWDLKIILKKEEIPPLKLGVSGRLGWTSWLADQPPQKDADDLILAPI
ncbi:MAG: type VI secretion system baseplate subunit TssG [Planctomycetes bacterium]|nr:type VI secretion system baseplate subunit TssG [Planctomycetota bacterium]